MSRSPRAVAPSFKIADDSGPPVRLKLESGLTLRATADTWDSNGATLTADLPWLRVGSAAEVDLAEAVRTGRIEWISVDTGPEGAARLSLHVTFTSATRHDTTLPYFYDEGRVDEPSAPLAVERVQEIVKLGSERRVTLALWRAGIALFTVVALATGLLVFHAMHAEPPALPQYGPPAPVRR